LSGLKHQKEKRNMDHFAGLDVSVKEASICIVDDTGRIVREVKVVSEPEALLQAIRESDIPRERFSRGPTASPNIVTQCIFANELKKFHHQDFIEGHT
jgi:hypothetical protein